MLGTLIYVLVVAIVIGLVWWVCDFLPVPQPLNKLVKMLSIVIGVIVIIYALMGLVGAPLPGLR
jgi:uncharacterized membrane protein YczE